MSAMRTRLLAAAALCGVLAPTADCWAQAYGHKAVVDHNDLRWFEPIELDLDGQAPRRDAGFFFSADKLYWGTVNPRVEIGSPGLVVDSEQIFRAPTIGVALSALEENAQAASINTLGENLANTGLSFVIANTQGTDRLSDDVVTPFDVSAIASVADLETQIVAFNNDPANIANNLEVRVGGAPQPIGIRNGILDGIADAAFAAGERYEFGYSDADRGWKVTILDGPEAVANNVFGIGDNTPGDSVTPGNPGTVPGLALGFGSVPVNFELPNPDFLTGFRDYLDNDEGVAAGTQVGPLLFVRNFGISGVTSDLSSFFAQGVFFGDGGATIPLTGQSLLSNAANIDTAQGLADPSESLLLATVNTLLNQLVDLQNLITIGTPIDPADPNAAAFTASQIAAQDAQVSILALQTAINNAIAADPMGMVAQNAFDVQIAQVVGDLTVLNNSVLGLNVTIDGLGDGDDGVGIAIDARLADDINGNGNDGQFLVQADLNGNGIIEFDETIAVIADFGDLFQFNVFFDQVTVRNRTEINGVELMRTHQLSTRHKLQQGRWDSVEFAWGVSFTDLQDDFFFGATGSIFDATSVSTEIENQIVGPQFGLKWIRRDGPWDFVLEGRGTLGYNIVDIDQNSIFASTTVPGALNRSATARPTAANDGRRFDEFSPLAELRAQLRYRLAKSVTLQAGYTAKYLGNIHRASEATRFAVPFFGINDTTSDIFVNGVNVGVEFRH